MTSPATLSLFRQEPRDTDGAVYSIRAAAYWRARANETGDPDDDSVALRWESRAQTLTGPARRITR